MRPGKRRIYLLALAGIFIVVIPVMVLISMGYRVNGQFRLVKTGGIYLVNDESDLTVTLDGKKVERVGMFGKNMLIRDLIPKRYSMTVEKKGCRTWKRNVKVEEQMVEVCYPFLIPVELDPQVVPKYVIEKDGKKSRLPNEEYAEAMNLFKTVDKPVKGFIPGWEERTIRKFKLGHDRRLKKKVLLSRQGNTIYVQWTGSDSKRPLFIGSSGTEIVFSSRKKIQSFGFFPERHDSLLVLLGDRTLLAVEIDTRDKFHNIYKIVSNCSRFAVMDEYLYYVSGNVLYRIEFN